MQQCSYSETYPVAPRGSIIFNFVVKMLEHFLCANYYINLCMYECKYIIHYSGAILRMRACVCVLRIVVLLLFTAEKKPASCLGDSGDLCERHGSPPPGSANIFRTCRIPPDIRSNQLTLRAAKNEKK